MARAILAAILLLAGCDRQTELFNSPPIEAPLTQADAYRAIYASKHELERRGYVCTVWPGSQGKSMGQAISDHSLLLTIDDFAATSENDAVIWSLLHEHTRHDVLHQVVTKTEDAMRTAGMNNSLPDWEPVTRGNYKGTVVMQVYYRSTPQ